MAWVAAGWMPAPYSQPVAFGPRARGQPLLAALPEGRREPVGQRVTLARSPLPSRLERGVSLCLQAWGPSAR